MRSYLVFFVFFLVLVCSNEGLTASDNNLNLSYLKEWNGLFGDSTGLNKKKMPSGTFMQDKNVLTLVKNTLPPSIVEILISGWKEGGASGQIQVVDDILIYHKCRAHMCPDDWITLYIDLESGKIQCISCQSDDRKKFRNKVPAQYDPARWYVTKEPTIIGVQSLFIDDWDLYKKLNKL